MKTKIIATIRHTVTYASETWALAERDMNYLMLNPI